MTENNHEEKPLITKGVNVPTSLERLKEPQIKGHPWFVAVAWGSFFLTSVATSAALIHAQIPAIPAIIFPGVFFFILAMATSRTRSQVLRTHHHILLIIRILRKKSTFKKYRLSLDELKRWIPLESIEETGLCRYKDGTSMIPIMLDPPRNSATDLHTYNVRLLKIINTLYGDFAYQFYSLSAKEKIDFLAQSTTECLNQDCEKPIADHMYSILEYADDKRKQGGVPEWDYVLFVYLPITKSIKKAEEMKDTIIDGLSAELYRAKILSNVVDNRNNCIILLHKILTGSDL